MRRYAKLLRATLTASLTLVRPTCSHLVAAGAGGNIGEQRRVSRQPRMPSVP
jgi:hypothetical protein